MSETTSLTLPAQRAKLKIDTTVNHSRTEHVQMEVDLPYFCKEQEGASLVYYGIYTPADMVRLHSLRTYHTVSTSSVWYYEKEIARATQVTREEFLLALSTALVHIDQLAGAGKEVI